MDEIASLTPICGGISYDRIEERGIQWPCPTKTHPGTTTLYEELFSRPSGKAIFVPLEPKTSGEVPDADYPFLLITGRRREHYNNGSMSRRCKGILAPYPEEGLEINPADAERLNVAHEEVVAVSSRRGEIQAKARVTRRSQPGEVLLAFHHQDVLTNLLTSDFRDPITGTPEYKVCAVRIEKLPQSSRRTAQGFTASLAARAGF